MFKKFYLDWIKKSEEKGLFDKCPVKKIHPFEYGLEYIGIDKDVLNPKEELLQYIRKNVADSYEYFTPQKLSYYEFNNDSNLLRFESSIKSPFDENNIVRANFFSSEDKKNAIIVVPHWNANGQNYDKICSWLRKLNFTSLRLVMPYHEERDPIGPQDSTYMVSANIGATIQAMRQCIHDIRNCIDWLMISGYQTIAILGASLGSCATAIAAYHDSRIKGFFANFMSSYFGDVVWTGASTAHIRKSLEGNVTLEELREFWLLNSPIAFVDKIKLYNPGLKQMLIIGKYDTTFLYNLSQILMEEYNNYRIDYRKKILPCGHYSLGKNIFAIIDSYLIISFLNSLFKN
jgi:hypothetical protein